MARLIVITTLCSVILSGCAQKQADRTYAEMKNRKESATIRQAAVDAPASRSACASDLMELASLGKKLFNGKGVCFGCHGVDADGRTRVDPDIETLNPKPTDLRDSAALKFQTDESRFDVIRNGIKKTAMPPFRGILYDNEIRLIIEYLEVLKDGRC